MYFLISIPISVTKTRLFKNNGIFKINYGAVVFFIKKKCFNSEKMSTVHISRVRIITTENLPENIF